MTDFHFPKYMYWVILMIYQIVGAFVSMIWLTLILYIYCNRKLTIVFML